MRIKTKLLFGFTALILMMFVIAVLGIDRSAKLNGSIADIYENRYQKEKLATDTRSEVNQLSKYMANLLLSDLSEVAAQQQIALMNGAYERAMRNLSRLSASSQSDAGKQKAAVAAGDLATYGQYKDTVIQLLGVNKKQEAVDYRNAKGLEWQERLIANLDDLANFEGTEMEKAFTQANANYRDMMRLMIGLTVFGVLAGLIVIVWIILSVTRGLDTVKGMMASFRAGKWEEAAATEIKASDEIGQVAGTFRQLVGEVKERHDREVLLNKASQEQAWLKTNVAQVATLLHGVNDMPQLCQQFIGQLAPILGVSYGAFYAADGSDSLQLSASYAYKGSTDDARTRIGFGEGLVGQCAVDGRRLVVDRVPEDYFRIKSGLGETLPHVLVLQPIVFEGELYGVVELAAMRPFTPLDFEMLDNLAYIIGGLASSIHGRMKIEQLLRDSQALTEELQAQSEELMAQQDQLRKSNERLEEQTQALKHSEELLQRQQEQLEHTNAELEAKTHQLMDQVKQTEFKNNEIEKSKSAIEQQAIQLALTSKYKSEFLANMSHELRTPLNSLLILSQMLADNKGGNLSQKQVEFAQTIHSSGSDLLNMIDEVLDLSKVDAGRMELNPEACTPDEIRQFIDRSFDQVAAQKGVTFHSSVGADVPESIETDGHRLKQILRNLLSNAFKFTHAGTVSFDIRLAEKAELPHSIQGTGKTYVAFAVKDTGIGIAANKQDMIFEAFRQADGTTSRKYGGTGLGLSISRELAKLLGGSIGVESIEGKGSTFTVYIPARFEAAASLASAGADRAVKLPAADRPDMETFVLEAAVTGEADPAAEETVEDDRETIGPEDRTVLIIEDDRGFARILLDMARSRGFKGLVDLQGDTGLAMAFKHKPNAILLDIQLPGIDGWSILNRLKHEPETRHIPVHVISVTEHNQHGLAMGAIAQLKKPADREQLEKVFSEIESFLLRSVKRLLIVENDEKQRVYLEKLIGHDDIAITCVSGSDEAIEALVTCHYDCMVLDVSGDEEDGFELLARIPGDDRLQGVPVIVYSSRDLSRSEQMKLKSYSDTAVIKDVKSPERLLDETVLFLHRVEADLPEDKRKLLRKLHKEENVFIGKRILLVDDDIRNVFAISSALENCGMEVTFAENGREALENVAQRDDYDLVLMDIMMPEMDGYEAMRAIRAMSKFDKLPIIALTAKAMKEDRIKCIEAGASDYVMKPIGSEQLLSLMRVWLYK